MTRRCGRGSDRRRREHALRLAGRGGTTAAALARGGGGRARHASWPASTRSTRPGVLHGFEPSKRDFIGGHGSAPMLLVQGPPGTGKSYSTAFALFARIQGAMAAGMDFAHFVSCKTHAATDVLLDNVVRGPRAAARARWLRSPRSSPPTSTRASSRCRSSACARAGDASAGVIAPCARDERAGTRGSRRPSRPIQAARWCVVGATPGRHLRSDQGSWPEELFGHHLATVWSSTRPRR